MRTREVYRGLKPSPEAEQFVRKARAIPDPLKVCHSADASNLLARPATVMLLQHSQDF
jgi:hypothetical protein